MKVARRVGGASVILRSGSIGAAIRKRVRRIFGHIRANSIHGKKWPRFQRKVINGGKIGTKREGGKRCGGVWGISERNATRESHHWACRWAGQWLNGRREEVERLPQ